MGVLYLLLSLSVMVPMAFLTEAVVSRLSTELQGSATDVTDGVAQRRVKKALASTGEPTAFFRNSGLAPCNEAVKIGVRELLEGDASPPPPKELSQRFFLFPDQPLGKDGSGFLVRILIDSPPKNVTLLPDGQCSSGYTAPATSIGSNQVANFSICRVEDLSLLFSRKNAMWKWTWSSDAPVPPERVDYTLCEKGLLVVQKA